MVTYVGGKIDTEDVLEVPVIETWNVLVFFFEIFYLIKNLKTILPNPLTKMDGFPNVLGPGSRIFKTGLELIYLFSLISYTFFIFPCLGFRVGYTQSSPVSVKHRGNFAQDIHPWGKCCCEGDNTSNQCRHTRSTNRQEEVDVSWCEWVECHHFVSAEDGVLNESNVEQLFPRTGQLSEVNLDPDTLTDMVSIMVNKLAYKTSVKDIMDKYYEKNSISQKHFFNSPDSPDP